MAQSASAVGTLLLPKNAENRSRLQTRLIQAGYYNQLAMPTFLGIKVLLLAGPIVIGGGLGLAGLVPLMDGLIYGALAGALGLIAPSFWLDSQKAKRQMCFRRALPDALDVLVICLEGGGSLQAALQRVSNELRVAHPLLAEEMAIVMRETQLGNTMGESLRHFADRIDLEEIRSLSAVIIQVERFGSNLVKALQVHAESFRRKRMVRAEELAQKASLKLLFPTILFIFPAMMMAILGPTMMEVLRVFRGGM